jgi:hypothetical protein
MVPSSYDVPIICGSTRWNSPPRNGPVRPAEIPWLLTYA